MAHRMSNVIITKYADRVDRAAQLLASLLRSSRGTGDIDITLDATTDDVTLTVKKAAPFVVDCMYKEKDVLLYVLKVEGGGIKAVFV